MKDVTIMFKTKRIEASNRSDSSGEPMGTVLVPDNNVIIDVSQNRVSLFTNYDTRIVSHSNWKSGNENASNCAATFVTVWTPPFSYK